MRFVFAAAVAVAMLSAPAFAAPCRDHGKFVKCPPKVPVKAARCRDAKGKFAKCGSPGAKPAR